jgi:hypothetical protein
MSIALNACVFHILQKSISKYERWHLCSDFELYTCGITTDHNELGTHHGTSSHITLAQNPGS